MVGQVACVAEVPVLVYRRSQFAVSKAPSLSSRLSVLPVAFEVTWVGTTFRFVVPLAISILPVGVASGAAPLSEIWVTFAPLYSATRPAVRAVMPSQASGGLGGQGRGGHHAHGERAGEGGAHGLLAKIRILDIVASCHTYFLLTRTILYGPSAFSANAFLLNE